MTGRPVRLLTYSVASGIVASVYVLITVLASFTALYGGTRGLIQIILAVLGGPWLAAWLARRILARDGRDVSVPSLAIGATLGFALMYVLGYALGTLSQRGIMRMHDDVEAFGVFGLWVSGPFIGALLLSYITARGRLRHPERPAA